MSDFRPKVSIIIPVYNGGKYMKEAIDSALAQTYENIEIIVVNDGSTDNSKEIALSYGDKIKYFYKGNGGQSSALNLGIEQMTGDYFSWLSHDDVYHLSKIDTQIRFLTEYDFDERIIVYSNYEVINSASVRIGEIKIPNFKSDLFRYMLLTASPINGCTALIPKKAFYEVGMFNENRPHTSDVELFFNMAEKHKFVHIPQVLIKSRTHVEQMTQTKSAYHNFESNLFLIYGLENIKRSELAETGRKYPEVLLYLARNWASRGYRKAFLTALNSNLNNGGNHTLNLFSRGICEILVAKKYIREYLKILFKRFVKW
jgi:glycosyltransferase involved in cell wall biosynthesis